MSSQLSKKTLLTLDPQMKWFSLTKLVSCALIKFWIASCNVTPTTLLLRICWNIPITSRRQKLSSKRSSQRIRLKWEWLQKTWPTWLSTVELNSEQLNSRPSVILSSKLTSSTPTGSTFKLRLKRWSRTKTNASLKRTKMKWKSRSNCLKRFF
jgi:hypothetical protein